MLRRWACVGVVTLCCLLTLATSASAECAWVLWQGVVPGKSGRWNIDTGMEVAFQTKADCEQQLKARLQFLAQMEPRTSGPTPFLACLPDTVAGGAASGVGGGEHALN